jgi:hypothetical protein
MPKSRYRSWLADKSVVLAIMGIVVVPLFGLAWRHSTAEAAQVQKIVDMQKQIDDLADQMDRMMSILRGEP